MPSPEKNVDLIEIPGRSGYLSIDQKTFKSIEIPIEMNFITPPDRWGAKFRAVKKWLLYDSGELVFMDDASVYYKVKKVVIDETEREVKEGGVFTAAFTCDPFTYYKNGKEEIPLETDIFNPGYVCEPIYKISGEGLCTLTVNGNAFTANVGQEIIIDSSRQISYKTDGQMLNTDVTGDYSWLWLNPGENTLSASDGFTVTITPEWRDI